MSPFSSGNRSIRIIMCKKMLSCSRNYIADKIASFLEKCVDVRSLRKAHAFFLTRGFNDSIHIRSKLLHCYACIGSLSESRLVFDKIIDRSLTLWNSAIVGYFRAGRFDEVLWLYSRLKLQGIGIDSVAVTFSLKSCTELEDAELGRKLHADAIKAGLTNGKFIGSSLVGLYSTCGSIKDAREAFDEIMDKDLVAYTAMVTGYAHLPDSQARMAFMIVRDMWEEGLDANRVTLVSLLQAAGQLKALTEGKSVHCYSLRRGIGLSDEILNTSLVDMYTRCGASSSAACILRHIGATVASWNALLSGLIHSGRSSEALQSFYLMVKEANCAPDSITLAGILTACSHLNYAYQVTSIHGYLIRRELPVDLVVATTLLDLYSKCGKTKEAKLIFSGLKIRDEVLYNVMISSYVENNEVDEAIRMLVGMMNAGIRPNSVTMLSLISAFADLRDSRRGRWIHGLVVRNGLYAEVEVCNQIISMYAKLGYNDIARRFFNLLSKKDLVSWTSMIMGYVHNGKADEALELFQLMRPTGEKPDSVIAITLLQALCQIECLEKVKEIHGYIYRNWWQEDVAMINSVIMAYAKCGSLATAEAVFSSRAEQGRASYNTMIAAYGIHGHCNKVLELFYRMLGGNMIPDEMTFTSVLSACSHAGLVEEGWKIFNSMGSNYFPFVPKEEHYNCMVDLLSRAGRLEEAYEFIKCSPLINKTDALRALLAACRVHRNTKLGEVVARQLLDLEPQSSSVLTLVSNFYTEAGEWNDAACLRNVARNRGLMKVPGYSLIKSDVKLCGV